MGSPDPVFHWAKVGAGTVEKLQGEGPAPRPLYLQGHGNKVEFRNIWVKEKK